VNQITVALDGASNLLAEVRGAVKRVLDGLHGKVSVATVDNLKNKVYPPFRDISKDATPTRVSHFLASYEARTVTFVWVWTIS
jgi:hypothetical protein